MIRSESAMRSCDPPIQCIADPCRAWRADGAAARRAALGRQGTFAWNAAVGPALERVTTVKLERRVLIVEAASAQWSREIQRSSGVILARLQSLLGKDTVSSIIIRTDRSETSVMRESVIVTAVRTPTGKFLGVAERLHRDRARRAGRRRSGPPRRHRPARSSTSASWATSSRAGLGQNPARQAALSGGLPDHVAALTINKVCGSGLKAVMLAAQGDPRRRHRHRRRRRHGVDEQLPVSAAARPRRAAHGQRRGRRLDDQRRPVVRVRAVPHGQRRARSSPSTTRSAAPRRTSTPRAAIRRRRARPTRARSRTRSCRSRFRRRRARRSSSTATRRSAPTPPSSRSPR